MDKARLVPKLMNYQGYLTDTLSIPISDTLDMTFKIFDAASSGNELWSETQTNVAIERGVFSVILGVSTSIPDSVFSDFQSTWLELTLEGPQTLTPRTRITSVGYAYTSTYADTADYANTAAADNDWSLSNSVLYTGNYWGIARGGAGNTLYGDSAHTHVNLGNQSTTGASGQHYYNCTVGGGYGNTATGYHATVGGGRYNVASSSSATVAGGNGNHATQDHTTVSGGQLNTASNYYATVGGGVNNAVNSWDGTVCGGRENSVSGSAGVIAGGYQNFVAGDYSAICGGRADTITASADYSYLFGIDSKLTQDSTIMIDVPHIRFGDEVNGYEFPNTDGTTDQVLATNGSGQLSWQDVSAEADTDWIISGSDMYSGISGNVGIGTTTPNYDLEVNGDVHIEGDLTWEAETSYIMVPAAAFDAHHGNNNLMQYTNYGSAILIPASNAENLYFAPLFLPHGATITKLTLHYVDSSPDSLLCALEYGTRTGSSGYMAWVYSQGTGAGSVSTTTISSPVVDNVNYSYFLQVLFGDDDMRVACVGIEYVITKPY